MDNKFKKIVKEAYVKLREEFTDEDGIIHGGVDSLTLGCFLANDCNITRCRRSNYLADDMFIIKEDDVDITKYSKDYIVKKSSSDYVQIFKKGKGKCCPFYRNNCSTILESLFRVYPKNRIV